MTGITQVDGTNAGTTERTFKLSTPLLVHSGEQKTELTLKMPTMRAFLQHGTFFRVIESGTGKDRRVFEEFDYAAVKGFAAAATGIPAEMFDSMAANDVHPLAYALLAMVGTRNPPTP